jgi:hypothetical protein
MQGVLGKVSSKVRRLLESSGTPGPYQGVSLNAWLDR